MHSWLLCPGPCRFAIRNSQNHSILSIKKHHKSREAASSNTKKWYTIRIYITHKNIRIKTSFSPCTLDTERVPIEQKNFQEIVHFMTFLSKTSSLSELPFSLIANICFNIASLVCNISNCPFFGCHLRDNISLRTTTSAP